MAVRLGRNCSINRNTGTYGSPSWSPITQVKDGTLQQDKVMADASTRGSGGWKEEVGTMKEGGVDFDVLEDTTNANWQALRTSYYSGTPIDVAILNAPATESGANGLRAYVEVAKFERTENLEGLVIRNVTIKPTYPTDGNHPVEFTV